MKYELKVYYFGRPAMSVTMFESPEMSNEAILEFMQNAIYEYNRKDGYFAEYSINGKIQTVKG